MDSAYPSLSSSAMRVAEEEASFPPMPPNTDQRTATWLASTARLQLAEHRARETWHRQQALYWEAVLQAATSGGAQAEASVLPTQADEATRAGQLHRSTGDTVGADARTEDPHSPHHDVAPTIFLSSGDAAPILLSGPGPLRHSRSDDTEPGQGAHQPTHSPPMRRDDIYRSQPQLQRPEQTARRSSWESQQASAPLAPSSTSSFSSRAPPLQHLTLGRPSVVRQKSGESKRPKPHGRGILASWFGIGKRKAEVSEPFNIRKMSTGANVSSAAAAARASTFHNTTSQEGNTMAQDSNRAPTRMSPQTSSFEQQQYQQQQQQPFAPSALALPGKRLSLGQLLNVSQASPNSTSRSNSAHNSPESTSSNDSSFAYATHSQQPPQQQPPPPQQPQFLSQSTQPPMLQKPRSLPPTPSISASAPSSRSASPLRALPAESSHLSGRDAAALQSLGQGPPPSQGARAFSPTLPSYLGTDPPLHGSTSDTAPPGGKRLNWPPGPPPLLSQQQSLSHSPIPSAPLQSPPSRPSTAPGSPFAGELFGVSISMRQSSPPPLPPFATGGPRAPAQARSQSQPSSPVLSEAQAASARRAMFEQGVGVGGAYVAPAPFAGMQGQQLQMGLEAAAHFQRRKDRTAVPAPPPSISPSPAGATPPVPPPKPAAIEKLLTQQRPPLHHHHSSTHAPMSGGLAQPGAGPPPIPGSQSAQWDKEDKQASAPPAGASSKSGSGVALGLDDPSNALKFERMRSIPPPPPPSRPQRDHA